MQRELEEIQRRIETDGDAGAWGDLATWAARTGRCPGFLGGPGGTARILEVLRRFPASPGLARLLEAVLPVELPEGGVRLDTGSGRPEVLVLRPLGLALEFDPAEKGWVARDPLPPPRLSRILERLPARGAGGAAVRSLRWFDLAEAAQRLTDRFRAAGELDPSYELRVPRFRGKRHCFPADRLRLVLAPARRKVPRPPELRTDRAYMGYSSALIPYWFRFFPDGRVHQATGPARGRRDFEARFLAGERVTGRGRREGAGRWLRIPIRLREGLLDFRGFLGDDGALRLSCRSEITGHVSATVYRVL